MFLNSQDTLIQSEEKHKENVYKKFDKMRKDVGNSVYLAQAVVDKGAYEDQDAFMVHDPLNKAKRKRHETEALIQKLYKKPYFAHVETRDDDSLDSTEHYYLSDCETLDQIITISQDEMLIPFKQDKERPILRALFHCYQEKSGKPVSYSAPGGCYRLIPHMICDDEIYSRVLINAIQFFPKPAIAKITADELLEEKLEENRNNPTLRNIIATLQRKQFEIIAKDVNQSFIVQGCAGSGKSQILLHRLFFLRDTLSEEGWNHVLLLTPTQLFRKYSAELVRRYQLSSVENCSIADLYRDLLNAYDSRFKNRQYQYELSEEYLPDGYLWEVYNNDVITKIESEINKAIKNYTMSGCSAIGIDLPSKITSVQIMEIVDKLDETMKAFDTRESVLQIDEEYALKRKKYEELQNRLEVLQKRKDKLLVEYNQIIEEDKKIIEYQQALEDAEHERLEWHNQREEEKKTSLQSLYELERNWNSGNDIQMPSRYVQQLSVVQDFLWGERFRANNEYALFLDEYCNDARNDLKAIIKNQTPDNLALKHEKRKAVIIGNAEKLDLEIASVTNEVEEYTEWLRKRSEENAGEEVKTTLRRTDMERARHFLSRIESTVFEREVWNALVPLKEKYHIQTLQVESLKDGRQKEKRILYKSDLLFYLKIYASLYPDAKLPDYRLICVDEGQDLHEADYDILHRLFPKATFNIFGDTAQVLHTACGITDWQSQTGIHEMYYLKKNYRNTAAIVYFCNNKFHSEMECIGKIKQEQQPNRLNDPAQIKAIISSKGVTLIVKDRNTLERFCSNVGKPSSDFEYLDTKAASTTGKKIPCYSIFAAKGLEFRSVMVFPLDMTTNQKVVACTRAMEELYYYE